MNLRLCLAKLQMIFLIKNLHFNHRFRPWHNPVARARTAIRPRDSHAERVKTLKEIALHSRRSATELGGPLPFLEPGPDLCAVLPSFFCSFCSIWCTSLAATNLAVTTTTTLAMMEVCWFCNFSSVVAESRECVQFLTSRNFIAVDILLSQLECAVFKVWRGPRVSISVLIWGNTFFF